jgi:hypothetical protein
MGQMRLDALEVGEIESRISVEIALEEQGKSLREYRFHLNAKRRELVRDRLLKLIDDIDVLIKMLVSLTDGMPINGGTRKHGAVASQRSRACPSAWRLRGVVVG